MPKNNRIAIYVNPKDEITRQQMDRIVAMSADFRSRNDYIWAAVKRLNKLYLPNEEA